MPPYQTKTRIQKLAEQAARHPDTTKPLPAPTPLPQKRKNPVIDCWEDLRIRLKRGQVVMVKDITKQVFNCIKYGQKKHLFEVRGKRIFLAK
jgi:hypothetical protein